MKMPSLNLSRFRKVAEDKNTSTFQHHDAPHTITIAHKALPREQRNFLKNLPLYDADKGDPEQDAVQPMADGGDVERAREIEGDKEKSGPHTYVQSNPGYKKAMIQAMQKKNLNINAYGKKYADGGRAHYDDPQAAVSKDDASADSDTQGSGPPININIGSPPQMPSPEQLQANQTALANRGQGEQPYGLGDTEYGTNKPIAPQMQAPESNAIPASEDDSDRIVASQAAPTPAAPQPDTSLSDASNQLSASPQAATPAGSGGTGGPANIQNTQAPQDISYMGGVGQEIKGQLQGAQALGALGQAQAPLEQQAAAQHELMAQKLLEGNKTIDDERANALSDFNNGHIDPNSYWNNHSKIATALGLLIGGYNPTSHSNGSSEFLEGMIKQDTDKQLASLGAKRDILSHYIDQFHNQQAGIGMANVLKTDAVAARLRAEAAKSQNAQQAALFNQEAGKLEQSAAQQSIPLKALQGAYGAMNANVDTAPISRMLRIAGKPELADSLEAHNFPDTTYGGGGRTDNPITPAARAEIAGLGDVVNKTQALDDAIKAHVVRGQIDPVYQGKLQALAGELAASYTGANNLGVSEGSQKEVKGFINQEPGGFLSYYMDTPKLGTIANSMRSKIENTKKQFGFAPRPTAQEAAPSQQQQEAPAPNIQKMNGVSYQLVTKPDGTQVYKKVGS